ncbi:GlsB/YeaQ/YmgE family stress response membrane protein [Arsenicicoccus sp. oral taxon 190]|nr:GlsB/YeaQ/YmgE family stress response membrane protein [Arsenicicoccus sp. oral taxon 190]
MAGGGLIRSLFTAVLGAVILLWLLGRVTRRR